MQDSPSQAALRAQKATIRLQIKAALAALPPERRAIAARRICEKVRTLPAYMNSRLPLLFYPLADEVDIRPLLEERSKAGLAFCLPRYEPTLGTIVIHKITNLESQLAPGAWKIMEPLTTCPQLAATEPDLILVPGVAFDAQGYRLGRGKGLYDRLLAQTTDKTLGICLGVQHVAMLPREDFDIPVQQVLSEEA